MKHISQSYITLFIIFLSPTFFKIIPEFSATVQYRPQLPLHNPAYTVHTSHCLSRLTYIPFPVRQLACYVSTKQRYLHPVMDFCNIPEYRLSYLPGHSVLRKYNLQCRHPFLSRNTGFTLSHLPAMLRYHTALCRPTYNFEG